MKKALIITLAVALQVSLVCVGSLWARQDLALKAWERERQTWAEMEQDRAVNPLIDYPTFLRESAEAFEHRKDRRVDVHEFLEMARDPNTIILDTRSKKKFDMKHVAGAKHLNFSDFTESALSKVIPSKDTRVLIYCNNNFKTEDKHEESVDREAFGAKYEPYALNITTYSNLYGYGYKNVYELAPAVDPESTEIPFASEEEIPERVVRAVAGTEQD